MSQELPGDLGRYGRRWLVRIPAESCMEEKAGLCPRILVSAGSTEFVSESAGFNDEIRSEGDALSGTDAAVVSSRWIEGWRGYAQQARK